MTLLNFSFYVFCCFVTALGLAGLILGAAIIWARYVGRHSAEPIFAAYGWGKAVEGMLLVALFFLACALLCALLFGIYAVAHAI